MARLLFLSALVVVLGSALGGSVEFKQLADSKIHKVNLNEADFKESIEDIKRATLNPTLFYTQCLGQTSGAYDLAKEESEKSRMFPQLLETIAAEVNQHFDKYNDALEKANGGEVYMTLDEFEVFNNGIHKAIDQISNLRLAAVDFDQVEQARAYCQGIYRNVVLIKVRRGLPGSIMI